MIHTVCAVGNKDAAAGKQKPAADAAAKAASAAPARAPGQTKAQTESADVAHAGMPAWQGLGLGPGVIAAIAGLGFEEPTPIQRECMLPAIRDRRDVIGAAQTV